MPRQWTDEQIDAALAAYGGEWKRLKTGTIKQWVAPDGTVASYILTSLHVQSKQLRDLGETAKAERDAKRKAVPKF